MGYHADALLGQLSVDKEYYATHTDLLRKVLLWKQDPTNLDLFLPTYQVPKIKEWMKNGKKRVRHQPLAAHEEYIAESIAHDTQERESNLSVRQKRQLKKKEHKQKGTPQSKHQDGHSLPASGAATPREVYGSNRELVAESRETPKEIINHQKSHTHTQSFGTSGRDAKFLKAGGNEATKKMTS